MYRTDIVMELIMTRNLHKNRILQWVVVRSTARSFFRELKNGRPLICIRIHYVGAHHLPLDSWCVRQIEANKEADGSEGWVKAASMATAATVCKTQEFLFSFLPLLNHRRPERWRETTTEIRRHFSHEFYSYPPSFFLFLLLKAAAYECRLRVLLSHVYFSLDFECVCC